MNEGKYYKNFVAWQKADQLASAIFEITKKFPSSEQYIVVSQLKRASLSVPVNIVEGYGRIGRKENKRFVTIALGSLAETDYLLYFCYKHGLLSDDQYQSLENLRKEAGAVVWGYHRSL